VHPDSARRARIRRLRGAIVVATALALVTGCGSIPVDGPVRTAEDVRGDEEQRDPYVTVHVKPPAGGETPDQIVGGFLEASGVVMPEYAVARAYLAPAARKAWNPSARTTVYDQSGIETAEAPSGALQLTAPAIGSVDDEGVFTPARPGENIRVVFRLTKIEKQWRIADPPAGIYMSLQDFEREYRRVHLYFPDPTDQVLVPDAVFLPIGSGLVTALARSLLRGPTRWLAPAVKNAFPPRTELATSQVRVESGVAEVRLTAVGAPVDSTQSERLIAQLTWTLTQVPEVTSVRVFAGERPLNVLSHTQPYTRTQWQNFVPADMSQPPQDGYFVQDQRVFTPIAEGARFLFGRFGDGTIKVFEVAASPPDAAQLSVVTADGAELWMARTASPGRESLRLRGRQLHSPSFDQFGNLWVVDGRSTSPVVRVLRPAGGPAIVVDTPELRDRSVQRLRVADDGVRVALITHRRNGPAELLVGRVERSGGRLSLGAFRVVEQRLIEPHDVAWDQADRPDRAERLVVIAQEPRTQRQPYFVSLDGYEIQPGEPLAGIESISAAPRRPLVAATEGQKIWELGPGGSWVQVEDGVRPVYPG
jgi:hypothetical protein